jgi:hypothetical protein
LQIKTFRKYFRDTGGFFNEGSGSPLSEGGGRHEFQNRRRSSLFTKAGWAAEDIIFVTGKDGRTISLWKEEQ